MITLYHGSTTIVRHPEVARGKDNLDFGKAFYLTRLREQAEKWAHVAYSRCEEGMPLLNRYELDWRTAVHRGANILSFREYNQEWLDFIVASRRGEMLWLGYDIIKGGVANDRVIDTIEGYMAGDFTAERAIERLRHHRPNNQMAILNQSLIDDCLRFVDYETLPIEP